MIINDTVPKFGMVRYWQLASH